MCAIAEDALTFARYSFEPNTIKARCYPRSLLINHLRMVEYVCYALNAVACTLAYLAIYITLTDSVIKLA